MTGPYANTPAIHPRSVDWIAHKALSPPFIWHSRDGPSGRNFWSRSWQDKRKCWKSEPAKFFVGREIVGPTLTHCHRVSFSNCVFVCTLGLRGCYGDGTTPGAGPGVKELTSVDWGVSSLARLYRARRRCSSRCIFYPISNIDPSIVSRRAAQLERRVVAQE